MSQFDNHHEGLSHSDSDGHLHRGPSPDLFPPAGTVETLEDYQKRLGSVVDCYVDSHKRQLHRAGMPIKESKIENVAKIPDPIVRAAALFDTQEHLVDVLDKEANSTGSPIKRDVHGNAKLKRFENPIILNTDLEKGSQIPGQLYKWGLERDIFTFLGKYYYEKWASDIKRYEHTMSGYGGDGVYALIPAPNAATDAALLAMRILIKTNNIAEAWYKLGIRTSEGKPHWTRIGIHGGEGTFVEMGNIMNSNAPEVPMGRIFNREYERRLQEEAPSMVNTQSTDIPFSGIHFVGAPMNQSERLQAFGKEMVKGKSGVYHAEESNIWMTKEVWEQLADKELKDYFPRVAENVAVRDVSKCTDVHALLRGTKYDIEELMKRYEKQSRSVSRK